MGWNPEGVLEHLQDHFTKVCRHVHCPVNTTSSLTPHVADAALQRHLSALLLQDCLYHGDRSTRMRCVGQRVSQG